MIMSIYHKYEINKLMFKKLIMQQMILKINRPRNLNKKNRAMNKKRTLYY